MSDDDIDASSFSDDQDASCYPAETEAGAAVTMTTSSTSSQQRELEPARERLHRATKRKRREDLKLSLQRLQESVPKLRGKKVSSVQVLKQAADYIQAKRSENRARQDEIEALRQHNLELEQKIRALEQAQHVGRLG